MDSTAASQPRSKALRLKLWMSTDQMSEREYLAPCVSKRHTGHVVTHLGINRWSCDCPSGQYRPGDACQHIQAAVHARAYYEATNPKPAHIPAPSLRMVRDGEYTEFTCDCRACRSAHPADSAPLQARARGPRCSVDDGALGFGELLAGVGR